MSTVNKKFDNGIRVAYSKTEEVSSADQIEHRLVRAAMKYLQLEGGIEITTIADIPSGGTDLGSSSSCTVGLLHVLNAYKGRYVSGEQLGRDSCHIEIDMCGELIGKQDQHAAAFGGFNLIEFKPDDSVVVSPIICDRATIRELEVNTLVFYTGIVRSASNLLKQQAEEITGNEKNQRALMRMAELAYIVRDELHKNNVAVFGEILHVTSGASTGDIDEWYRGIPDAIRAERVARSDQVGVAYAAPGEHGL